MKHNSSVVAVLIIALIFALFIPLFKTILHFDISIFDATHVIKGKSYSSIWINVIQLTNVILVLIFAITITLLFLAFRKWNNLKYYDISIIKKLDIVAYLFIFQGIALFYISLLSHSKDDSLNKVMRLIKMDPSYSTLLIVIGLLFALITSILTNAKLVKDENDLTI